MNLRANEFAGDGRTGTSIESEREETVAALCSIPMRGGWNASAVNGKVWFSRTLAVTLETFITSEYVFFSCCTRSWLQRSNYEENIEKDWSFTRIKIFFFFLRNARNSESGKYSAEENFFTLRLRVDISFLYKYHIYKYKSCINIDINEVCNRNSF